MNQATPRAWVDPGVAAVAFFALAIAMHDPVGSTVTASAGLFLTALSVAHIRPAVVAENLFRFAGLSGVLVLFLRMRFVEELAPLDIAYVLVVVSCLAVGALLGVRRYGRRLAVGLGLIAVILGSLTMILNSWEADTGTDVYLAHVAAGSALAEGENPYTSAVRVQDSSPYREPGGIIQGYNYPPVILMTYGLAATFTDPRLVSMLAWFLIVGWVAKESLGSGPESAPAFAVFLLLATMPMWPMILAVGWTEPLSAALFLAAGLLWERRWQAGAAALGLALGSKQYFVVLAPLVLVQTTWKRGYRWGSVGVAALTVLAGAAVFGADNVYRKLVADLLEIPFRPDTLSLPGLLYGLGIPAALPRTAALAAAPLAALALTKRVPGYPGFLLQGALILGVVFLAVVALPNYWLMVLLMVAIGRVTLAKVDHPATGASDLGRREVT